MDVDLDPDVEAILTTFNNLKSRPSRRAAYLGLLNQLSPNEWRDLKDATNERPFHCDVLTSLPLEIAGQITKYLDLSEIFLLQRVSKQWQKLLSSHYVRDLTLRRRTGCGLSPTESESAFKKSVERRLRIERGKPLRVTTHDISEYEQDYDRTGAIKMDYSHGRCALIKHRATVAIFCLRAEKVVKRFDTENREPINDIRISDSMVAIVTSRARCYTWNIHTEESYEPFRLASLNYDLFIIKGQKVAFNFPESTGSYVIQWCPPSRTTRTVHLPPELVFWCLHPTTDDLTSVHFCRKDGGEIDDWNPCSEVQLRIITFSPSGNNELYPKSSKDMDIPVPNNDHASWMAHNETSSVLPFHRFGCIELDSEKDDLLYLMVSYDSETDQLFLHKHETDFHLTMSFIIPKVVYYGFRENHAYQHNIIRISTPDGDHPFPEESTIVLPASEEYVFWGDEQYFVVINISGLAVWYFDETALPDAAPDE